MTYWPVRIETSAEVVEVLIEAQHDRAETLRLLIEQYARAGLAWVLLTVGPEPVEGPPGPRGRVTPLADVVACH